MHISIYMIEKSNTIYKNGIHFLHYKFYIMFLYKKRIPYIIR